MQIQCIKDVKHEKTQVNQIHPRKVTKTIDKTAKKSSEESEGTDQPGDGVQGALTGPSVLPDVGQTDN